jgi:hypothetical protein
MQNQLLSHPKDSAEQLKNQNWDRINKWAIKLGNVTIAKYIIDGNPRYIRWEGDKMSGIFDSSDAAKGIDSAENESGYGGITE